MRTRHGRRLVRGDGRGQAHALVLIIVAATLCLAAAPSAASAAGFRLGVGTQPDAFTDVDGVTHVVWESLDPAAENDTVTYCRVARGATTCAVRITLRLPPECTRRDTPGTIIQDGRPRVQVGRFGDVRVTTHALCRTTLPNGSVRFHADTILYESPDSGETFADPERTLRRVNLSRSSRSDSIYDEADSRLIGVQSAFPDVGDEPILSLPHGIYLMGNPDTAAARLTSPLVPQQEGVGDPQLVQRGRNAFAAAWLYGNRDTTRIRVRTFECAGCAQETVRNGSAWGTEIELDDPLGPGQAMADPSLASGPAGTYLLYSIGPASHTFYTRRITHNAVGPRQEVVARATRLGNFAQDPATGRLHMVFKPTESSSLDGYMHVRSDDGGATWGTPTELTSPLLSGGTIPVVTANTGDAGFSGMLVVSGGADDGEYLPGQGDAPPDLPPVEEPPPGGGGGGGGGQPSVPGAPNVPTVPGVGNNACKTRAFGPLEIVAEACLQVDKDGVIVAKGTIKLNGLTLAGKEIRFDPKKRLVESVGPVSFKLGDTQLFSIPIDWKLPAGSTFSLPGISIPGAPRFLGFPLQGSVDLKLVRGGVELPLHLGLPKLFGGFTGDVTVRADNLSGIRLRELKVKAGKALLGPVELRDVFFEYSPDDKRWAGGATVLLPPKPPSPALTGKVAFQDGELQSLFGELEFPGSGIPLDNFKLTHLTKIRFAMETKPELKLVGGVSFGAGERFGPVRAVEVDGDMTFRLPTNAPATLRADGTVKLVGIPVGRAYAQFRTDGEVSFGGSVDYKIGTFGMTGQIDGWVLPPDAFSAKGSASVCLGTLGCLGGEIAFSSKGMAACAKTSVVNFGAGYEWGPSVLWTPAILLDIDFMFSGCSVADYEVERPPAGLRRAQIGATRPVTIEKGLPSAVVGVTGTGAAPNVALISPTGERFQLPAAGQPLKTPGAIGFQVSDKNTTFFAIKKPVGGAWKVESLDATPIASVGHAQGLPDPKIVARVQGTARRRVLKYSITPLRGQRVRFEERSKNAAGVVGTPRAAKGTLRFSPASGPAGRRDIVAVVESFGKPRGEYKVASYVAPPPAKPLLPKRLQVKRAGTRLLISWAPQAGLSRYQLAVKLTDGRKVLLLPGGKARRTVFSGVKPRVGATVTLKGQFATGVTGPTATRVIKAPAPKKKKAPAAKKKR